MLKLLKKLYYKEQMNPSLLGLFCNPFYFVRKELYKNIKLFSKNLHGKVLDIGCGNKPYKELFRHTNYQGLEIDTPKKRQKRIADYFYDGTKMPFTNEEFDGLVSNEVFEHVYNPDEFLKELNRILKKEGQLLITVPFIWDEHEQPHDFARYTSFGLRFLLEKHGFTIIQHKKTLNNIKIIFQLINTYIYKKIDTDKIYFNLLTTLLLIAPFNILGLILSFLLPKNNDLYMDNIILAKKVNNA
jgi:SAM-dependent methyltransferase